ncbi:MULTISPECIES: DUF3261 domain-containing protein [Desulfobacula]|uniref:Conserved uncharacterized protein n=2 Tax=Desulfobacula TaxID=28222 RepID=K0NKB4_DESTT|nr:MULTISPECIES: DUF3261 domain-containing protein [Desulfobacula]CCK81996.1 conserved uncharacterized protein [Desulfobacula toluolica Tol2]SDU43520.1 hypothetical protein SAMN04487931_108192 [Desulfobacula phenolica]
MKFFLLFFSLLFIAGCSTIDVPEHNLVPLNHIDKKTACKEIAQYNDSITQKTNMINSTIFTFKGRSMTALGITKLDGENKNFSVAGFNPMGITLFKIQMEDEKVISSYVIPQFGADNLDKAASMISQDIAHIYFNRKIDLKTASLELDKYKVTINTQVDQNDFEYIFSGQPLKLTTKSMYKNNNKIWSVDYYDYTIVNDRTSNREIPFKLFFKNYKYGYVLEIETKEIK